MRRIRKTCNAFISYVRIINHLKDGRKEPEKAHQHLDLDGPQSMPGAHNQLDSCP